MRAHPLGERYITRQSRQQGGFFALRNKVFCNDFALGHQFNSARNRDLLIKTAEFSLGKYSFAFAWQRLMLLTAVLEYMMLAQECGRVAHPHTQILRRNNANGLDPFRLFNARYS
jgi:hypothetical protein